MKILINAINARLGGGQTYLFNLLAHMPMDDSVDVTLLIGSSFEPPGDLQGLHLQRVGAWVENPLLRPLWERFVLPRQLRRDGVDVLFCPGGVVGTKTPKNCKLVTMFRNMIPFDMVQRRRYPLGYMRMRNWILARLMLSSMQRADLVIFISEYAQQVIRQKAHKPLKAVVVIPHGVADRFRCSGIQPLPRPHWLPERYLLYVSNVDVYKAHVEVVRAFAEISDLDPGLGLLMVGPEQKKYGDKVRHEIEHLGLRGRARIVGKIPYVELPAAYQNAQINIFASECENCPNILLEALASGRPVVCSDRQPMPEFGGDAVLYFNPEEPHTLADQFARLLADEGLRKRYSGLALEHSRKYSWQKSAERTWNAIKALERDAAA